MKASEYLRELAAVDWVDIAAGLPDAQARQIADALRLSIPVVEAAELQIEAAPNGAVSKLHTTLTALRNALEGDTK